MNTDSPAYSVFFMLLLSIVFGSTVSAISHFTKARVAAGETQRLRANVLAAFSLDVPTEMEELTSLWQKRIREVDSSSSDSDVGKYYVAQDESGRRLGYGLPFTSPGFWGPIDGILAIAVEGDELLGISFISHQETPGLGGRISEEWFIDQFKGKPARTLKAGERILEFVYRKPASPREVEAITGATQTSSRLERFLNDFLDKVDRHPAFANGEDVK
jgi:Na+-transporting NADH:ubiquinone oxidoreductase subunit C